MKTWGVGVLGLTRNSKQDFYPDHSEPRREEYYARGASVCRIKEHGPRCSSGLSAFPDPLAPIPHPEVPVSGPVLVHRYFSKLSHFSIRSPIVPYPPPGYTLSSTSLTPLHAPAHPTPPLFTI